MTTQSLKSGVADQRSLEAFIQHFKSFTMYSDLSNFHFFHYADLKRDLRGSGSRIADSLKIKVSEERLDELCHGARCWAPLRENSIRTGSIK